MHALVASVLAGGLTYVILALVSRTVDDHAFDQFSVFWSLALIIGFGFFLPVEQEAARLGGAESERGAVLGAMMTTSAAIAAVVGIALLAAQPLLIGILDLTPGLALCCALVVIASAVQFSARGSLLSARRSRAFSNTLILDTVLRVVLLGGVAIAVLLAAPDGASTFYALAMLAAIVLAHVWAVPWRRWASDPLTRRRFTSAALVLVGMNLLAQLLVNAGPVVIQAFVADTGTAGAFQASSTVARIPLAIITPIQAMLVGPLAALAAAHDRRALGRVVTRVALAAGGLAVLGALAGWLAGPWVVELVFGAGRALTGPDMALLIAGVLVHVGLIIFTQAIIATGHHRRALVVWGTALVVAVGLFSLTVGSAGAVLAVELGFGVGSLAGAGLALGFLLRLARTARAVEDRSSS